MLERQKRYSNTKGVNFDTTFWYDGDEIMAKCSCYYEVGSDTIRRDTNPDCEVHGDKK